MPGTLRPNQAAYNIDNQDPPVDTSALETVFQPLPSSDQPLTVIRVWGTFATTNEDDPVTIVLQCWEAYYNGVDAFTTDRQIPGDYTVTLPALGMGGDPFIAPFFGQWIDRAQPQSACYMIVYGDLDLGDGNVNWSGSAVVSVGP